MRTFNYLNRGEGYHIHIAHKKKVSVGEIAKERISSRSIVSIALLGFSPSLQGYTVIVSQCGI